MSTTTAPPPTPNPPSLSHTLTTHLQALTPSTGAHTPLLTSLLPATLTALSSIATALRNSHTVAETHTSNAFGDAQLNVDVAAEAILRDTYAALCPALVTASSEEDPVEKPVHTVEGGEQYTVAFDPLDGSSIIAPNWTVGTIIGIWAGATALGPPAASTRQLAAVLGVYGPRTTAIIAVRIPSSNVPAACFEVGLGADDVWEVQRTSVQLAPPSCPKTKYFAPANLRAAAQDEAYLALVNGYVARGYTLRYSGGLVPDVVHALSKGHGIYVSPVTAQSKAKLRRLYELFPVALVVECAGGLAVDPGDGRRILERVLEGTDERAGLVCGTAEEVEAVKIAFAV